MRVCLIEVADNGRSESSAQGDSVETINFKSGI